MIGLDLDTEPRAQGQPALVEYPKKGVGFLTGETCSLGLGNDSLKDTPISVSGCCQFLAHETPPLVVRLGVIEIDGNPKPLGHRIITHSGDSRKEIEHLGEKDPLLGWEVDVDPVFRSSEPPLHHCSIVAHRP